MTTTTANRYLATRQLFTTGDVARACLVGTTTVVRWIDTGRLKSWRIPGNGHRRIERKELAIFLEETGRLDALEAIGGAG